jgi:hypothetical protein
MAQPRDARGRFVKVEPDGYYTYTRVSHRKQRVKQLQPMYLASLFATVYLATVIFGSLLKVVV